MNKRIKQLKLMVDSGKITTQCHNQLDKLYFDDLLYMIDMLEKEHVSLKRINNS